MSGELKLRRHESFSIREGWLEKGINVINCDSKCFSKDAGPINFGLGSNMCKSLKYWLEACNLATYNMSDASLTELGKVLLENDLYLEKTISWWIIHICLSTNEYSAPVINAFFNLPFIKADKDYIFREIKEYLQNKYSENINDTSLESDISVLLKSYYCDDNTNPEDNLGCPLGKLGLLKNIGNRVYIKTSPQYSQLDSRVVYFLLCKCFKNELEHSDSYAFNLEDLYEIDNNPLRILNITRSTLFMYLDELSKLGLITVIKTSGLNTVTIEKKVSLRDLLSIKKEY